MRQALLVVALAVAVAPGASSAPTVTAGTPNSVSTQIARTSTTVSGQPLKLPQGPAEMVGTMVEIPPGGMTSIHQHPWARFVYVQQGPLRVRNDDTGDTKDFQSGELFPEVTDQWHQGTATGPKGARLIVLDIVPPGVTNMKMR
jgi:quercetin dioxygenase-like cupin family protein